MNDTLVIVFKHDEALEWFTSVKEALSSYPCTMYLSFEDAIKGDEVFRAVLLKKKDDIVSTLAHFYSHNKKEYEMLVPLFEQFVKRVPLDTVKHEYEKRATR